MEPVRKKKSLSQSNQLQRRSLKKTPEEYMWRAIKLALKAQGQTSPNPLVGALIVKNGKIVGQGFRSRRMKQGLAPSFMANRSISLLKMVPVENG